MAYAWASKEIFGFIWFMIKQNLQKNKAIDFEEKIFEKYKKKIKVNTIISQRKKQNLHSIVKYIYEKL